MSLDVIRYSGDLKIATAVGGNLTLDTGVSTGTVTITGSLNVLGRQTSIAFSNTNIADNILLLNAGESNSSVSFQESYLGVPTGSAGIAIDRGSRDSTTSSARLLFREKNWSATPSTVTNATTYTGVWSFTVGNGTIQKLTAIEVNAIRFDGQGPENDGRLNLLGRGVTGMLSVAGQINYASRVLHEDDIPNKAYVDSRPFNGTATSALTAFEIRQGNSYIAVQDDSATGQPSKISTFIDDALTMQVQNNFIRLAGLAVAGNTLRPLSNNTNLTLQTQGTGTVVVNNGITVGSSVSEPLPAQGSVKIYTTSTLGAGSTGIYYTTFDTRSVPVPTVARGELISARKALVLSIIF
jgi:hypothetical protein